MTKVKFENVKISAIKCVVPENFINIDNEIEFFENSEKKLNRAKKIIGYGKRHIVDKNTTSLDLAFEAGKKLIEEIKLDKNSIDAILFLSQTRDYIMPTGANILHGLLDLSEDCSAMDLSQGCSGYVYGLWNAFSLVQSGAAKKILLLTADTISKYSYQNNRLISPIFGDSASATLIEYSEEKNPSYFTLNSRGKGWDKIIVPAGGARIPVDKEIIENNINDTSGNTWNLSHLLMEGLDVFDFTMDVAPNSINEVIEFSGISKENISTFVLHQANKQIVESVAMKAEIPLDKTPTNTFTEFGNTTCNSVALNLVHNSAFTNNCLLCAFGVGLSWASAILNIENAVNLGISLYYPKNTCSRKDLKQYWINKFTK